jgi:hypothetical protein
MLKNKELILLSLNLDLTNKTEIKLKKILEQYPNSELFAQNIIDFQTSELKKGIVNIEIDMKEFEQKYNLSTQEFYQQYQSGKLGDDEDYLIWAGIYEMRLLNQKRLDELE